MITDKITRYQLPSWLKNVWVILTILVVWLLLILLFAVEKQQQRDSVVPATLWPGDNGVVNASFNSVTDLEAFLDNSGMQWLPESGAKIPPLSILAFPGDIGSVSDVARKKSLFFRSLLPIVLVENHNISLQRRHVLELMAVGHDQLNIEELAWLESVAAWYRIPFTEIDEEFWNSLLMRIDRIPAPLVLAQAANESAWGTSRFALQGNNLFGLWTFDETKGIIPAGRKLGERHAVQVFDSLRDSVREYMRNLNTHRAYHSLRAARAEYRRLGEPLQADKLAQGLLPYSERGEAYVKEIRSMIKGNQLAMLKNVLLDNSSSLDTHLIR